MLEIHYGHKVLDDSFKIFIKKVITIGKGGKHTGVQQTDHITIIEETTNLNTGEVIFAKMIGAYKFPFIWKNRLKRRDKC